MANNELAEQQIRNSMSAILFESPLKLAAVLLLPLLATTWAWYAGRTPQARYAMVIVWVLTAGLLIVQAVAVTPREQAVALCHELARLAEAGDIAGIREHLDVLFEADGFDRLTMIARIEKALRQYRPQEPRLGRIEVELNGDEATATFNVTCRISTPETIVHDVHSRWRLTLGRRGTGWLVTCIEVLPTPQSPIASLRDLP
ncbi:MAG: hypothetical protein C4547_07845 [Phycisphaerales bacterium]|nr:MAG: hypothetical protein C4547_07845 [Phycisphaerales bacterium]